MRHFQLVAIIAILAMTACSGIGTQQGSQSASDSTADSTGSRNRIVDTITLAMTGDITLGAKYP